MSNPRSTAVRSLRAALLFVLLAAQGLTAAHEFTHWGQPAQELCATCSLSNGLDSLMVAQSPCLDAPQAATFREEYFALQVHHGAPGAFRPRAPPVHH